MTNLLKILRSLLVQGPVGVFLAVVRLPLLLIFGLLSLIVRFVEWLCEFLERMNLKEEEEDDDECNPPFPEGVMRRPDPCIYSQHYLASQGLSVTWNNPDIWMAKASTPDVIEPDSYHLEEDTDYIVSVRAHNASTDLALGVKVRLLYRPWSFNSPELLPVDTTSGGVEVVRFVNIPGMASAIAQFNWRTPSAPQGEKRHFCLQAHLSHPMDVNLENNMGQENTNVHSANPGHVTAGEIVDVDVPLFNNGRLEKRFNFSADAYAIDPTARVELQLRKNTGQEPWPLSKRLGNLVPTFRLAEAQGAPVVRGATTHRTTVSDRPRFTFGRRPRRSVTRARYVGHEKYKQSLLDQDFALPIGMQFDTPGIGTAMPVPPAQSRTVPVQLRVPDDAQTDTEYSINVRAEDGSGRLMGGVTFLLRVQN